MMRRAQPWLGSLVDIAIQDELPPATMAQAFQAAFSRIAELHQRLGFHAPDSELSVINRAPIGAELQLHDDTYTVLQAAEQLQKASAGLFDVRVGHILHALEYLPVVEGEKPNEYPDDFQPLQTAYQLLPNNGYKKLTKDWLDLGGIAKGFAVDQAIHVLQQSGVRNAIVNAGGDLRVIGAAQTIHIRHPQQPQQLAMDVEVENAALATSATYFSRKHWRGQEASALINTQTGKPITNRQSVTVQAPECMWADALTKVVAASGEATHPCLKQFGATAFVL